MNLKKHLNKNLVFILTVLIFSLLVISCSKKGKNDKLVAKVNKTVLTEDDLKIALSNDPNKGKIREEFIHDWIEKEVLFQQAVENGILDDQEYKSVVERNKRELAATMFLNKIVDEKKIDVTEDEEKNYFDSNKNEYNLIDDIYNVDLIHFNNFDKAVQFRTKLMETNWNTSLIFFRGEQSIIETETQRLLYQYQIQPITLLRIINNLVPNEVSVVVETEPGKFTVAQLITKYNKDTTPSFEIVKDKVRERLLMIKKKEFLKEYIDKLIEEHNTEVIRYSE
jgi:hypothetical protein